MLSSHILYIKDAYFFLFLLMQVIILLGSVLRFYAKNNAISL